MVLDILFYANVCILRIILPYVGYFDFQYIQSNNIIIIIMVIFDQQIEILCGNNEIKKHIYFTNIK